jgi:hypothetical protein
MPAYGPLDQFQPEQVRSRVVRPAAKVDSIQRAIHPEGRCAESSLGGLAVDQGVVEKQVQFEIGRPKGAYQAIGVEERSLTVEYRPHRQIGQVCGTADFDGHAAPQSAFRAETSAKHRLLDRIVTGDFDAEIIAGFNAFRDVELERRERPDVAAEVVPIEIPMGNGVGTFTNEPEPFMGVEPGWSAEATTEAHHAAEPA